MHHVPGADLKLENVELSMVLEKIGGRSILEFHQGPCQVVQMEDFFISYFICIFRS